jgi:hypothetical protein
VELGALLTDCILKNWQLHKIMKHVKHVTGVKPSSVSINKALKSLSITVVKPVTGNWKHVWKDKKSSKMKEEMVEWQYQSIVEVFKLVVASLVTEHCNNVNEVKQVVLILGGHHGVGAFRMPFRTVIVLKDGTIHKRDIGIATVTGSKDTVHVLMNTIMDKMVADLKTINDSSIKLTMDGAGGVHCDLHPKADCNAANQCTVKETAILITGDIKWFRMLLGMEGICCMLKHSQWKECNCHKGTKRTIASIVKIVEDNGLEDNPWTDPSFLDVKLKPLLPFIPISHYTLSLLHICMGIFNDGDKWYMDQLHLLLCGDDEHSLH